MVSNLLLTEIVRFVLNGGKNNLQCNFEVAKFMSIAKVYSQNLTKISQVFPKIKNISVLDIG